MAAGNSYCLGIKSNDFFLKDNKKAFILWLNVPKVTAYKSFEKKVPAHEIWAGIPAKKVKACAPGQAEEFAKHYSGYIKGWYLKEDK